MNGQERFRKTLHFEQVDRPPLFEDGIRDDVVRNWRSQGLGKKERLDSLFTFDYRQEIEPDLEPIPTPKRWPKNLDGLKKLITQLNPNDPRRLPEDWEKNVIDWKPRDYPVILRVHRGYFLTMGVHGWHRFTDAIELLVDDPKLVEAWMDAYAEFISRLAERMMRDVKVDAALFSEPIGGNHGPLISPAMYTSLVLKSYQPILKVLQACGVDTIIYRTYANTRVLLPAVVRAGFNCLWACECNPEAMNYPQIRQEFGRELRLIGGIDSDSLRQTKQDIYHSMSVIVPPLLEDGGFIPIADGRVREDVPYENYTYYRKLLEEMTGAADSN